MKLILQKGLCIFVFYANGVKFKTFSTRGLPYVSVALGSKMKIGLEFSMNNSLAANPIGRNQKCIFFVDRNAELTIGNNVGLSSTAIVCQNKITIGDNVKIGGGTCIYDTDFHSLDSKSRSDRATDSNNKICKPVFIGDNVFIGTNSTILKGVCIGNNSIVGACSVVAKDIPENQIWAGNPAKFIKAIE